MITFVIITLPYFTENYLYICPMNSYKKPLFILIVVSVIVRALIAHIIELGNDEVYYRIFALFPSLSYFDHPPLLAWIIRLTTFASEQPYELLVRLSSIIIGAANTYIIYSIAGKGRRGFLAAMLYTGSIYASVILGTFIMPDTPLSLFWLITLSLFIKILPDTYSVQNNKKMLLAGIAIGFAMLSKYTGAYLWAAAGAYILLFNRSWFRSWALYVAPMLSIAVFMPVLIWNAQNDFISFTFHSARVTADAAINWLYFGREIGGGIFYNNPVNYILIIISLSVFWKGKKYIDNPKFRFLITFSLPMILLFAVISLTSETLPHWAAPAFFALIILAAYYLDSINVGKAWRWVTGSVTLIAVVLIVGILQINFALFSPSPAAKPASMEQLGKQDVTLDMYGWRQLEREFTDIRRRDIDSGVMPANAQIINYRWDEAAHIDCYVALPNGLKLTTLTDIYNTHFYYTISKLRGGYQVGQPAYLLVSSRVYTPNEEIFGLLGIDPKKNPADTLLIERGGRPAEAFMLYRVGAKNRSLLPSR